MDELRAYYYSFAPTGQREVDLILHAVARAGKAFHHTSQWADDEMEGFYEHCEGDTCVEWIQNAANKAAAVLAVVRAHDRDGERLDWLEQNPRHENVPYFDESEGGWGFPYAISNANGLGGGIGFHRFDSLRAAIDAAMRAER